DHTVDVPVSEEVERATRLFETGPEHDGEQCQDQNDENPASLDGGTSHGLPDDVGDEDRANDGRSKALHEFGLRYEISGNRDRDHDGEIKRQLVGQPDDTPLAQQTDARRQAAISNQSLESDEANQAGHHADPGQSEGVVIAKFLADDSAEQWPEERSNIDAHVKDGKCPIAPRVARLVERADHGGDIRLEEAIAADDRTEGDIEPAFVL